MEAAHEPCIKSASRAISSGAAGGNTQASPGCFDLLGEMTLRTSTPKRLLLLSSAVVQ